MSDAPKNGLESYTTCHVRVSTTNAAATKDQVLLPMDYSGGNSSSSSSSSGPVIAVVAVILGLAVVALIVVLVRRRSARTS
jgi:subtilase family serine protease